MVQGRGFSKAMTAKEAQAFVGDEPCLVTILEDDKLFLVAPSSPPKSTSRRHRRDTSSEAMELLVRDSSPQTLINCSDQFYPMFKFSCLFQIKFGKGEWNVGSVRFERKSEVPLYIIVPAVLIPMVLFIAASIYCYR